MRGREAATLRAALVVLHRWLGLATAAFLFVAGATGAVISWDHELDAALNPTLFRAATAGPALAPLQLADAIERDDPRVRVTFLPLAVEPGAALTAFVEPRVDPVSGRPYASGYNQVAVDPATGRIQGRRQWGEVSLSRENLLPFLYKLHYSLHLPEAGGLELGVWFMGFVAIAWVLDTVVALALSFPRPAQWRRSFAFRWREGGHRLTFDLHRSGALWVYGLLVLLSVTSVGMNLREPVVRPIVGWFSELAPSPFADREPAPPARPVEPVVAPSAALAAARDEAARRGITAPAGSLFLSTAFGVWGVGFHAPGLSHGDGGLGNPWIYVDARTGAIAAADVPGQGSAGDVVMQSLFPLHSGRILGVPGRVLVSALGAAVAMLSVTGVLIWARKRRARRDAAARTGPRRMTAGREGPADGAAASTST